MRGRSSGRVSLRKSQLCILAGRLRNDEYVGLCVCSALFWMEARDPWPATSTAPPSPMAVEL